MIFWRYYHPFWLPERTVDFLQLTYSRMRKKETLSLRRILIEKYLLVPRYETSPYFITYAQSVCTKGNSVIGCIK